MPVVNSVFPPYMIFSDLTGAPLEGGQIYIGQPGFEARSTPKASFFDIALTIPTGTASGAAITTRGGYPWRNGAASAFYVDGDYSITVLDRNGVLIYTALNNTLAINVGASVGPVLAADGTLPAPGLSFASETSTGFLRPSAGTLQTSITGTLVSSATVAGTVFQQPISGAGVTAGVAGVVAGRNKVLNGQGRVNQRGYVSGTATSGSNEYTLDRWRVVTSGQNLTFTGSITRRVMTAPAGGVEQIMEGANIEGGTYTINWTGTATAQVNGVTRVKGETFNLGAGADQPVRFIGGTFSDVQIELGTVPSLFERMPYSDELARCQRYYFSSTVGTTITKLYADSASTNWFVKRGVFPTAMRVNPAGAVVGTPTYTNCSALAIFPQGITEWAERVTSTAAGSYSVVSYTATFDAEL